MINLKKQDNVADAVNEILQQEALKGNQHKIDANKNNKIDGEDFKILRGKKKVEEELKGGQKKIDKNNNNKIDGEDFKILRGEKKVEEEIDMDDRTKDTLVGREKTKQKDDVGPNSNAKVSKFKLKSEEAEQIDEKNVPTSPEKWAQAKSAAKSKFAVYPSAYANGWASKKYKSMGGGWKATSEEVEQIDELSKDTLGSYLDKKKSEYMKGKTQSGSKENAKDIQNMGKAHDKMKKEETQFNDHEKGAAQRLRDMRKNEKQAEKMDKQYQAMRNNKHKQGAVQRLNDMGKNEKQAEKMDKQYQAMRNKKTLKQMKETFEEPILDELIYEVMSQDASAGDYIHDFIHSDNPKFAGKSDAKRKEMALAAYYSKKNEEAVNEGLKDMAKKTFKALTGGSDKDHLDRLKKDMYGDSQVKYAAKTLVKHAKDPLGLKKEEVEQIDEGKMDQMSLSSLWHRHALHSYRADQGYGNGEGGPHLNNHAATAIENHVRKHHGNKVADDMITHSDHHVAHGEYAGEHDSKKIEDSAAKLRKKHGIEGDLYGMNHVKEGWDDMVKAAQEKVKSGPKPSGGSGKKEGSRYGGSKQKEKPEQDVKEATDTVEKDSKTGKVKSWMHTGDWKKSTNKDAHGKVTHASDVARRKTEKMSEGKDPNMDAGVGSQPNFVTDSAKPMQHAQSLAKKSLAKMRSDMMAKKSK
jgi:hypothetical protein